MSKKRRDAVALFGAARGLAESVLRENGEMAGRAERLTAGLTALWPAPLTAVLLRAPEGQVLVVRDEAGHARPEWHDSLRPVLAAWPEASPSTGAGVTPAGLDLPEHLLHGAAVSWAGRHYGTLALALHKRTADAALAQALLTHLADHLSFRLFQRDTDRDSQAHYRDLADLTNLVGHEFNNVLNAVSLQVAALAQKGLTPDDFPELAEVRRHIAAAGLTVRRLQEFCQKGGPPRQPADLNRAVRAALGADPALAGRAGFESAPGLPLVQGTALDLERLAGALLRGAGTDVAVRTGQGPGRLVWLRVEDRGADPDDDLLPHLFEPFVTVRDGDDGVALALAKAIARRIGGNVRGEKRVGGGMVFVAELRPADEGSG